MKRMISLIAVAAAALSFAAVASTSIGAAEPEESKVSLKILSWKDTQKIVAAHKGKIVVLDAWSTSCAPCMREFPNLVKLHENMGEDVACVSFSCDYLGIKKKPPEYYQERVLKFLKKQNATFENVLCNQPADELFDEMQLAAIPAVYVYDRDGKLVKRFDNDSIQSDDEEFTYADVNKLVEKLRKSR